MRNSLGIAGRILFLFLVLGTSLLTLGRSDMAIIGTNDQIRTYTRMTEYDYVGWTLDALWLKQEQQVLGAAHYLSEADQHHLVIRQIDLLETIRQLESEINQIYADPSVPDPAQVTAERRQRLEELKTRRDQQAPLVESIIQQQVGQILVDFDLTTLGQVIPPVMYQVTAMPLALVVSPRAIIRQDANISLVPDLSIEQKVALETNVEQGLGVSALVVPIGGVGVYPTMVMSTTDVNWLMEVVTHEWVHNYLTLRPLGINYFRSGELRTMNETTANLAGKELGEALIARYYPELVPEPAPLVTPEATTPAPADPPIFDFRAEMHTTRVKVDEFLAAGKVDEAESYMEARRKFFWKNGYLIRRLNQAYFAFYGAYADGSGGEAGQDPVGPAVVKLRDSSTSLAEFLKKIGQMTSFSELQQAVDVLP
jgi:hypothetical protein